MKIKKYDLKIVSQNPKGTTYEIVGLKTCKSKLGNETSGACGLIQNASYPGYATLMYVYHAFDNSSDEYDVRFLPMYDDKKNQIIVKFDKNDVLFGIVDICVLYDNGDKKQFCKLSVPRHGVVDNYKEDKDI